MNFDFFHKKVNRKEFLKNKAWHQHTLFFFFVPEGFDHKKAMEQFKDNFTGGSAEEWLWNADGQKRYFPGVFHERSELVENLKKHPRKADPCGHIKKTLGLQAFEKFTRFSAPFRTGPIGAFVMPMYEEDECVGQSAD